MPSCLRFSLVSISLEAQNRLNKFFWIRLFILRTKNSDYKPLYGEGGSSLWLFIDELANFATEADFW